MALSNKRLNMLLFFIVSNTYFEYTQCYKVLVITSKMPENSATAVLNQVTGLIDNGVDVRVFSKEVVNIHALPKEVIHPNIMKYNLLQKTYYGQLPHDLKSYDAFICQNGKLGEWFAGIKKKLRLRGKLLTTFRGSDATVHLLRNSQAYKRLFKIADLLLPCCEFFKNNLVRYGGNKQKILVQHTSIDTNKFYYQPVTFKKGEKLQLVTVCRLVSRKGIEYAIEAVAQVAKKYPNIEYNIIGFGKLESSLKALIKRLSMNKHIKLLGRLSQNDVAKELHESHIAILTSITGEYNNSEGIPNALKEAMACGMPVIGTMHAGNPELITDGVSGFLVPERNSRAIADKISYLIDHPEVWTKIGIAARAKVEREFDIKKENNRIARFIEALINNTFSTTKFSYHRQGEFTDELQD